MALPPSWSSTSWGGQTSTSFTTRVRRTVAAPSEGVSAEELSARVANGDRFEVRPAAASSDDRSSTPLFYVSPAGVPSMLDRKFKNSAVGQLVVLVAACDGEKR